MVSHKRMGVGLSHISQHSSVPEPRNRSFIPSPRSRVAARDRAGPEARGFAVKGRRAFTMVRAANRQEEGGAQQLQAHHFGHQYTIWKTEDVDKGTGQRVLCELKPRDGWRDGWRDGRATARWRRSSRSRSMGRRGRTRRSVWARLTRLLYIESRNEVADDRGWERRDDDDVLAPLFRLSLGNLTEPRSRVAARDRAGPEARPEARGFAVLCALMALTRSPLEAPARSRFNSNFTFSRAAHQPWNVQM